MKRNKKIALLGVFLLLFANNTQAFSQDYTPRDAHLKYQSYFNLINIEPSWSNDLEVNKEVVVAVLDSGVDIDHPDLSDNIWVNSGEIPDDGIDNDGNSYIDDVHGWDFVESNNDPNPTLGADYNPVAINHGTVVAGIIAAVANQEGIIGIAPNAKIMPLKILNEKGSGNTMLLSQAIDYAVENGADIINLSLVGDFYDDFLQDSVENAYKSGVLVVAASGNEDDEGIDLDIEPHYPVCDIDEIDRVAGVAAVSASRRLTPFSNYGQGCIDISAPGVRFYTTTYFNADIPEFAKLYSNGWSGTSVAAPVVAATAALLKSHYADLRPYDIMTILNATAQDLEEDNPELYRDMGSGLIDVGAAINYAEDYYNQYVKILLAPKAGLPPEILIMDNEGDLESVFLAYGAKFKGGVNIAVGDVNDDGATEIITAPMAGGGPHIRVFDMSGGLVSEFFAYQHDFYGGVNIAVGDVNKDGIDEIITAPMAGGGPHVRVFDMSGALISEFFPYEHDFYGGVNIAVGDVNKDGADEIITAPMSKHVPEIKVYTYNNRRKSSFFAYGVDMTNGVKVTVADVNNDTWPEIVTVPAKGRSPEVKMFSIRGRLKGQFTAYSKSLTSGISILARDISGDKMPEILTLPSKGSAALLESYDSKGLEKDSFYLRDPEDKNGYNFEILSK
ncbi:S8 family serine peptidase [Candidatus Parcubacteria bacterium]|nr:S8 family serine peptidase [Candidatus Parcubacteria bacterium]